MPGWLHDLLTDTRMSSIFLRVSIPEVLYMVALEAPPQQPVYPRVVYHSKCARPQQPSQRGTVFFEVCAPEEMIRNLEFSTENVGGCLLLALSYACGRN